MVHVYRRTRWCFNCSSGVIFIAHSQFTKGRQPFEDTSGQGLHFVPLQNPEAVYPHVSSSGSSGVVKSSPKNVCDACHRRAAPTLWWSPHVKVSSPINHPDSDVDETFWLTHVDRPTAK